MKRIITISLIIIAFVGGCAEILLLNKKKIEEKSKLEGNLESIPVYVSEIKRTTMSGNFEVNGSFMPVHELTLMSEGQGKVTDLSVNTGDFVQTGQVLVRLDDELV